MNQNYGFTAGYGTPLITTQTANYGTQNPGPTAVTPFMSETVRGEMMGTASDGSSLAAHSPIVHAMPVKIMTPPGKHFIPEGTLMVLTPGMNPQQNITQAAQNCKSSEDYVVCANAPGSAMVGPGVVDARGNVPNPVLRIIPTASGCHNEDKTNNDGFVDVVAFAWKSVTRIAINGDNVYFDSDYVPDIIRPGQPLYAACFLKGNYNQLNEFNYLTSVTLFTDISKFRQNVYNNSVNDVIQFTTTGGVRILSTKVFKLGTVTLPCNTADDLWIHVNLCANQCIA